MKMTKPKGVLKKRINKGNRFYRTSILEQVNPRPSCSTNVGLSSATVSTPPSSSKTKRHAHHDKDYDNYRSDVSNILISLPLLSDALRKQVVCKSCGGEIKLSEERSRRNGLACILVVEYLACNDKTISGLLINVVRLMFVI